jgi:hypothetical protein
LRHNLCAPGGAGNDERETTPTIPTTIRTTPTTGRLTPLTDAGTANFKIAPTRDQHQTRTDSHQPDSYIQVRAHLAVTQVRAPVPPQANRLSRQLPAEAECDGGISCAPALMASSLAKPV